VHIRWLPQAADDLEGIYNYALEHYSHLAHHTVTEIYEAIGSLKQTPFRGKPGREPDTREFVLPRLPYIFFYRIKEQAIEILYIRHGAQDR
jgi:toxin ParE1/3/4